MRTVEFTKLSTIECVLEFFRLFPDSTPAVLAALARLKAIDAEVRGLLRERMVARRERDTALYERNTIGDSLRRGLSHLVQLAATAAIRAQRPELKLNVSFTKVVERDLSDTARAVLDTAATNQLMLQEYGMPARMLEELTRELDRYDAAQGRRENAVATCTRVRTACTAKTAETKHVIRNLDILNRIRFAKQPERLAEWAVTLRGGTPRGDEAI